MNLSEMIINVNCVSCSILYVTFYVARKGDYAEGTKQGAVWETESFVSLPVMKPGSYRT